MATAYKYRINIIVPVSNAAGLDALWTLFGPEGDGEIGTFSMPLSADGNEPETYRGMSTAATEDMRLFIRGVLADELAAGLVSVQDYRENDWPEFLQAAGLQAIAQEVI